MGSRRRSNTLATLGRVAVVPLPPQRSGVIDINSFPYEIEANWDLNIKNVTPLLPESFTMRLVVNGISGPEKRYPEEKSDVMWSNGGVDITCEFYESPFNSFALYNSAQITYASLDCYIDGVNINLSTAQ